MLALRIFRQHDCAPGQGSQPGSGRARLSHSLHHSDESSRVVEWRGEVTEGSCDEGTIASPTLRKDYAQKPRLDVLLD